MSIRSFRNKGTEDIALLRNSKQARKLLPASLHEQANLRLLKLDAAVKLEDIRLFPSYCLEKLKGNRKGQYSIRINDQYRICFLWEAPNAFEVEIVDYH